MRAAKTEVLQVDPHDPDRTAVCHAADVLAKGGLVVLPTDTVYGLVCDPAQPEAVERIYRVKGRERDLPLVLLLHDMSQVTVYVEEVPAAAAQAMQEFWPGALTVVLRDRSKVTAAVRAKKDTVGLRLPAHLVPRLVAECFGGALASTSANRSRRPAPATAAEALEHMEGLVELVLDGGPAVLSRESTVVSFAAHPPQVLREGAIGVQRLREVLGEVRVS
jgi:L-threonylcarbamoyladenylate synthase